MSGNIFTIEIHSINDIRHGDIAVKRGVDSVRFENKSDQVVVIDFPDDLFKGWITRRALTSIKLDSGARETLSVESTAETGSHQFTVRLFEDVDGGLGGGSGKIIVRD